MMRFIIVHDARTPGWEVALNTAHIVAVFRAPKKGGATRIVTIGREEDFWAAEDYTLVKRALEAQEL